MDGYAKMELTTEQITVMRFVVMVLISDTINVMMEIQFLEMDVIQVVILSEDIIVQEAQPLRQIHALRFVGMEWISSGMDVMMEIWSLEMGVISSVM